MHSTHHSEPCQHIGTRRFDAPHYGAHANRLPGTTQRARGTCDVWSVPAERLGDAVVVVDEEGRGRKACPIRSCVCSSCCSGRALGFWEPGGSAINECSRILVMHSERAQTLARSHTRPPKEEPREEELLALHESRMERNESRRVKRVQGRYCTYRTKHKQIGNYKFCFLCL